MRPGRLRLVRTPAVLFTAAVCITLSSTSTSSPEEKPCQRWRNLNLEVAGKYVLSMTMINPRIRPVQGHFQSCTFALVIPHAQSKSFHNFFQRGSVAPQTVGKLSKYNMDCMPFSNSLHLTLEDEEDISLIYPLTMPPAGDFSMWNCSVDDSEG